MSIPIFGAADLRGADLSGANLREANLRGADLSGANLAEANLSGADLSGADVTDADLREANLSGADVTHADLTEANLSQANLSRANLARADLTRADLTRADLTRADLNWVNLSEANLSEANLSGTNCTQACFQAATLVRTMLDDADLTGAHVYGVSAWDLHLTNTVQRDLIITPRDDPSTTVTVDDLEVAQFIYLLLHNNRIRKVIDAITSKVVLILGRFTPERKAVLDAIREELRKRDYLPVVFDFEKPTSRDLTETVSTLAHMAKFIVADLTDAKSLPQELATIVPFLPSVPVQPILLASEREWGMYEHFPHFPWVLPIARYETATELLTNLSELVIRPAERRLASADAAG